MLNRNKIIKEIKEKGKIIEKFLGYKNREVPEIIIKKIKKELEIFDELIEIEYEYKFINCENINCEKIKENDIKKYEKLENENNEKIIYCIYTIGEKLDKKVKEYMDNGQGMKGMILDKIGIVVLDTIKEHIKKEIFEKYGYKVKKEIYPGNKNSHISLQKEIFDKLENIKTVKINEYYQLNPIKTVALKFVCSIDGDFYNMCEDCENPCEIYGNNEEKMYQYLLEKSKNYTKKLYEKLKIKEEIYLDNIKDLEIWGNYYKRKTGEKGIFKEHFNWVNNILEMKVIKLGRLQFELLDINKEEEIVKKLMKNFENSILVNVHIRENEKFSKEECENSYILAKEYYKKIGINFEKIIFICYSWLLNPNLYKIINYESNILNFQKKYKILYINDDEKEPQIIERVYGDSKLLINEFEQKTKLQINLKKAWEKGEKFPMTKGYFVYE